MTLKWTKEKPNPKKDEWYWIRWEGAKNEDGNPGTKIIRVIKTSFGIFVYGFGAIEDIQHKEFAGPIPEPME